MSVHTIGNYYTGLTCSEPGCRAWYGALTVYDRPEELFDAARRDGWRASGTAQYCPIHALVHRLRMIR